MEPFTWTVRVERSARSYLQQLFWTQGIAWKGWLIGMDGEKDSGKSVLTARHNDDELIHTISLLTGFRILYHLQRNKILRQNRVFWVWLNRIWGRGSILRDLGNEEYPFYSYYSKVHSESKW